MNTNKALTLLLVLVQTLLFTPFAAGTTFSYNDDAKCNKNVELSIASLTCDGDSSCDFNSKLSAYGTISFSSDIPESGCVKVKSCFMGVGFICRSYTDDNLDLCEEMNLESTSDDGAECPSAGAYSFDTEIELPSGKGLSFGSGAFSLDV
jgi:hypothetical protein